MCWGGNLNKQLKGGIDKIVKRAGSVIGKRQEKFEEIYNKRVLKKLLTILENDRHPLYSTFCECKSTFSKRLNLPKIVTERFRNSFLPQAIRIFNDQC